ncbi:MAG: NAD(P)-binding domain-containing protein [Vicinamibacterales bacterium]
MRISIIGTGNIGGGLGRAWAARGHAITFGVRNPADPEVTALAGEIGAAVTTIAEALPPAEVVVLATPFGAVPAVAQALPDWTGRVVVDCTNPIGPGFTLLHGHTDSGAEDRLKALGANYVQAGLWQGFAVRDGNAITGQQNFSGRRDGAPGRGRAGRVGGGHAHLDHRYPETSAAAWACLGGQGPRDHVRRPGQPTPR